MGIFNLFFSVRLGSGTPPVQQGFFFKRNNLIFFTAVKAQVFDSGFFFSPFLSVFFPQFCDVGFMV